MEGFWIWAQDLGCGFWHVAAGVGSGQAVGLSFRACTIMPMRVIQSGASCSKRLQLSAYMVQVLIVTTHIYHPSPRPLPSTVGSE